MTGLKTIDGKKYYFSKSSGEALTGLRTIDGKKYYFSKSSGEALTGLRTIDGKKYYFSKSSGEALTGLRTIDGKKYYFSKSSHQALKGLRTIGGEKYYFDTYTCEAINGFKKTDGNTYYFSDKDFNALRGLKSFDKDLYYFNESTFAMTINKTITYCNINFTFGSNGVANSMKIKSGFENDKRTNLLYNGFSKLGLPYGSTADGLLRCNTFAAYCYNSIGYTGLNNLRSDNQAKYVLAQGGEITASQLKPGDLIFFNIENSPYCDNNGDNDTCSRNEVIDDIKYHVHHVSIYLGNGKTIDTSSSAGHVKVRDLDIDTTSTAYYPVLYGNLLDK